VTVRIIRGLRLLERISVFLPPSPSLSLPLPPSPSLSLLFSSLSRWPHLNLGSTQQEEA
jgi:hypothetical protein